MNGNDLYLSFLSLMNGSIIGIAMERIKWVDRTRHLNICEHSTPRCDYCWSLRR
jgi:hypothetical protein